MNRRAFLLAACAAAATPANAQRASLPPVGALKITIIDTNLSGEPGRGDGEWGFAALVEADGRRFLYDTGGSPSMALNNARALGIELADIENVILSHNHQDHTSGLITLRETLAQTNPRALSRCHVGAGMFAPRFGEDGRDHNFALSVRERYLASGGGFIIHDGPSELAPGIWMIAPVPRPNPERNWSGHFEIDTPAGRAEDIIAEDASLVIPTADGLVLLTGCGHAGIVNISEEARRISDDARIDTIVGGIHLMSATDEQLAWTGRMLRRYGVRRILAAHCTGMEATYRLRRDLGRPRGDVVVAAVGASFTAGAGIDPLMLSR